MSGLQPPAPYPADDQEARDRSNLRVLSVLFYVFAGLAALCSVGSLAYGFMMQWMMGPMMEEMTAQAARQNPSGPPPPAFFRQMGTMYLVAFSFGAVLALTQAVLAFLAGRALGVPRSRTLCIVASVAVSLSIPLGTVLGVFALVVLVRPSVERLFLRTDGAGA